MKVVLRIALGIVAICALLGGLDLTAMAIYLWVEPDSPLLWWQQLLLTLFTSPFIVAAFMVAIAMAKEALGPAPGA